MKNIGLLFAILFLILCAQSNALITVRTSGGNYNNFQQAVDAATGTETILVGNGTYTGANNRNITIDKDGINLTIESENGPGVCIIDAQGLDRVFGLLNVNGVDSVAIRGFTIKNGNTSSIYGGGGVYNHNSVLTLEGCIIQNNTSSKGGGIYSGGVAGSLTMVNCTVIDNYTYSSSSGGALHIAAMGVDITDCIFANNSVLSPGMHAGAFYISYGDVTFTNCLLENNNTNGSGGLFYCSRSDVDLINCTIVGNRCSANGGIGFISGSSTFPSAVTLRNTICDGNIADGQSNLFRLSGVYVGDAVLNYSYSDLDPAEIGGYGETVNDLGGNINADPLFGIAGYWSGTSWVSGDYHPKSMVGRWVPSQKQWVVDAVHSPCIDAGDAGDPFVNESTPNGERVNMGYYGNT